MRKLGPNQSGVTLIELMIATVCFSVVLVIVIYGFLFVSNDYIKGTVEAQTQATARAVIEEVTQDIQLNNSSVYPNITTAADGSQGLCIGDHRYSYQLNKEIGQTGVSHALVVDSLSGCDNSATAQALGQVSSVSGTELLGNHMRLGNFSVSNSSTDKNQYTIAITIAYGDDTTQGGPLNESDPQGNYIYSCPSINLGGKFCATANLTAVVEQRVSNGGAN